jgi:hypothetical protein
MNSSDVAKFARVVWNTKMTFVRTENSTDRYLEDAICAYGPQPIGGKPNQLNKPNHWVTATGIDQQKSTFIINDPSNISPTTLNTAYGNVWSHQVRRFAGPEYTFNDVAGIWIRFHSPGELLLTDPSGRRTGINPLTGQSFSEIPSSIYHEFGQDDDETGEMDANTIKEVEVAPAVDGEYKVDVLGTTDGTYALEIRTYDLDLNHSGATFEDVPISAGQVHGYRFQFSKAVGSNVDVSGAFDGGGQRPKDVNRFLSYANLSDSHTSLPSGTTIFPLSIF